MPAGLSSRKEPNTRSLHSRRGRPVARGSRDPASVDRDAPPAGNREGLHGPARASEYRSPNILPPVLLTGRQASRSSGAATRTEEGGAVAARPSLRTVMSGRCHEPPRQSGRSLRICPRRRSPFSSQTSRARRRYWSALERTSMPRSLPSTISLSGPTSPLTEERR